MLPIASIIIPAFNASAFVAETIRSCLDQTVSELEVIVINDGSLDDTSEIARSFDDPRVTVIDQENRGVGAARNHGIDIARGQYLQFLDADDLLAPNKIEAQVRRFQQTGDVGLGTSRWGRFRHSIDELEIVPAADWQDLSPSEFLILQFGRGGTMPPNSLLVPRTILGDLRFRTNIDAFEDRVFTAEIAARSQMIVFTMDTMSYYRRSPQSLSVQSSLPALRRQWLADLQVVETMLLIEDSSKMRTAAANYLLMLSVTAYQQSRALGAEAERLARKIGKPSYDPNEEAGKLGAVAGLIGWQRAAILRGLYTRSRPMRSLFALRSATR